MAYANLKFSIGETVILVRKVAADTSTDVKSVQVLKSEIHCIELLADRTTYILKSGHHCTEGELIDELSTYALTATINAALD